MSPASWTSSASCDGKVSCNYHEAFVNELAMRTELSTAWSCYFLLVNEGVIYFVDKRWAESRFGKLQLRKNGCGGKKALEVIATNNFLKNYTKIYYIPSSGDWYAG